MDTKLIKCCGCQKVKPLAIATQKEVLGRSIEQEFCLQCAERRQLLDKPAPEPKPRYPKTHREFHSTKRKLDPLLVADLYRLGFNRLQTARLLGINPNTATRYLSELGVKSRPPKKKPPLVNPRELRLVLNRWDWEVPQPLLDLAKEWGLRPSEDSPVFAVQQRRVG
jgi:integrase